MINIPTKMTSYICFLAKKLIKSTLNTFLQALKSNMDQIKRENQHPDSLILFIYILNNLFSNFLKLKLKHDQKLRYFQVSKIICFNCKLVKPNLKISSALKYIPFPASSFCHNTGILASIYPILLAIISCQPVKLLNWNKNSVFLKTNILSRLLQSFTLNMFERNLCHSILSF